MDDLLQLLADAASPEEIEDILSAEGFKLVKGEKKDAPPPPKEEKEPEPQEEPLDTEKPVGELKDQASKRAFKRFGMKEEDDGDGGY